MAALTKKGKKVEDFLIKKWSGPIPGKTPAHAGVFLSGGGEPLCRGRGSAAPTNSRFFRIPNPESRIPASHRFRRGGSSRLPNNSPAISASRILTTASAACWPAARSRSEQQPTEIKYQNRTPYAVFYYNKK